MNAKIISMPRIGGLNRRYGLAARSDTSSHTKNAEAGFGRLRPKCACRLFIAANRCLVAIGSSSGKLLVEFLRALTIKAERFHRPD
jgi:hypothetical protein